MAFQDHPSQLNVERIREKESRHHLPLGLGFLTVAALILLPDLTKARYYNTIALVSLPITLLSLLITPALALAFGRRRWLLAFPIGILTALASAYYAVTVHQPGPCDGTTTRSGFPFPWSQTLQVKPFDGCYLLLNVLAPTPTRTGIFYLMDTVFYAILTLGVLEVSTGVQQLLRNRLVR